MALDGQAWYLASTVRLKLHCENTLDTVFSYLHEGKTGRRDALKRFIEPASCRAPPLLF